MFSGTHCNKHLYSIGANRFKVQFIYFQPGPLNEDAQIYVPRINLLLNKKILFFRKEIKSGVWVKYYEYSAYKIFLYLMSLELNLRERE